MTVGSITWQADYAILLLPASKADPFRLGIPGWNAHMLRSASSVLLSVSPILLSSGCMMGTGHSLVQSSSSTFAQHSLASGWTHPSMWDTPSVEEQPLGWCRRASTRTPLSFSAIGTQIAIADTLTVRQPSNTQWLPLPSTRPGGDPLSLWAPLGRTQSSKLGGAFGPSAVTPVCCAGGTAAVGRPGASLSSFEDLTGLCFVRLSPDGTTLICVLFCSISDVPSRSSLHTRVNSSVPQNVTATLRSLGFSFGDHRHPWLHVYGQHTPLWLCQLPFSHEMLKVLVVAAHL